MRLLGESNFVSELRCVGVQGGQSVVLYFRVGSHQCSCLGWVSGQLRVFVSRVGGQSMMGDLPTGHLCIGRILIHPRRFRDEIAAVTSFPGEHKNTLWPPGVGKHLRTRTRKLATNIGSCEITKNDSATKVSSGF